MGHRTILAMLVTLAAGVISPAVAQNNYAPPRGQSVAAAIASDTLAIQMCTPQAQRPLAIYGRTLAQEIAEGVAAGMAAQAQPDPECLARARAQRAPIEPSTLHAVVNDSHGYIALYIGGTHYCGDSQPLVHVQFRNRGLPGYGCWSLTQDKNGVPAVSMRGDNGKSYLWARSRFRRPDGSPL